MFSDMSLIPYTTEHSVALGITVDASYNAPCVYTLYYKKEYIKMFACLFVCIFSAFSL